jgi:hypothetical protein
MFEIGPQSKSDNKFVAKHRLHQSKYRSEILKENFGIGPTANSGNHYGNMLIDGEKSGSNFTSLAAFRYAIQRTYDKNINKYLTIDNYRLFNNMLSSMPMCFNLFSDLRELLISDKDSCSNIIKSLFKDVNWISSVEYIGVEFIPTPIEQYTNDKTAFDAIIIVQDVDRKKGVLSIETKYTDLLGSNSSKNNDKKNELIEKYKLFSPETVTNLKVNGYKQIYRNYLLTFAFAKSNKFTNFCNVIISPSEDELSKEELLELQTSLRRNKSSIMKIDLEEFINRGCSTEVGAIKSVYKQLKKRYVVI